MSAIELSKLEKEQLGTKSGNFSFFNEKDWIEFRKFLVQKSKKRNKDFFDEELAAYTPGETLGLLKTSQIQDWFEKMEKFRVPDKCSAIVLVPCAASKPWRDHANINKSKLYTAYNQILDEIKDHKFENVYFVTISEPCGVVPQELWKDFPKYDNPGLFADDFLRTGLVKSEWIEKFGAKYLLPFDEKIQQKCIQILGDVIGNFLKNQNKPIISFVDAKEYTTHGDMLDFVQKQYDVKIERKLKKDKARSVPVDYIKSEIINFLKNKNTYKIKNKL